MFRWLALISFCLLSAPAFAAKVADEAQRVYGAHAGAVYQVQVIDLASGRKSGIGSGFQIDAQGMLATNYHVVATAIQRPEANRLEYIQDLGGGKKKTGLLKVLMADVVSDLAILKMDRPGKAFVSLGASHLDKGAKLFSLGNPHDIGFTIIEGTYNGLSRESFIDKIHFSGSLNPGMSGGPALGHDGKVVGINVSTAGNQISFLVPVESLKRLVADYLKRDAGYDFLSRSAYHIENQLLLSQKKNIDRLLTKKTWESIPFGPLAVPGRIDDAFKCWGGPEHKEEDPYTFYSSACSSQDALFLDEQFRTGAIVYRYAYLTGKEAMNLPRFYSFYERQYDHIADMPTNAVEDNVTNFVCNSGFLKAAEKKWKASFCIRRYKKYPSIHDLQFYMALIGEGKQGFMASLSAQGVSREGALSLVRRFVEEIRLPAVSAASGKPEKRG